VESPSAAAGTTPAPETGEHGLKKNAIGFLDGLSIGLNSTAPAYSLAAVIGSIVVAVGVQAPAILLISFVPMFFIAGAFYYMNRADQDCGTTFSWVTRALGPWWGWMGGWAICMTGILVVGSLADVAAYYTYDLVGLDSLKDSRVAVVAFAVVIIAVMTTICVIGTELSARVQRVMILAQVGALALFAVVAIVQLIGGAGLEPPAISWFWPSDVGYPALLSGVLLGVFIYWGWESAVNLTEESEDSASAPGLAGLLSTVILVVTYVAVAVAIVGIGGLAAAEEFADDPGILGAVAKEVLGPLAFLVVLSIITSGLASTQTTILPASRTSLSMARAGALPAVFGRIHPRFLTPDVGTIVTGAVAAVWYVGASLVSQNFLFDSLSALSLMIAFYYALTGISCAVYYRRELTKSVRNFLFIGVAPLLGAAGLGYLLVESARQLANPAASDTGRAILGMGMPLVIAIFFFALGLVLMVVMRLRGGHHAQFFKRRAFESVPPDSTGIGG
jgi:amino acid transporter